MGLLYVSEYKQMPKIDGREVPIGEEPSHVDQVIDFTAGVDDSDAFGDETRFVRVDTTATCHLKFGASPTATTSHKRLVADRTEYFGVQPGDKVSVILTS